MEAFWTMVATVVPVVSLAVLVEIRVFGQRWYEQPAWIRNIQGLLWMAFLVGAVVVELAAVRAHRPSHHPSGWEAELAAIVIAAGMGILVLTPAIEIAFRVSIPLLTAVRAAHPRLNLRIWRLYFKITRLVRDAQKTDRLVEQAASTAQARLSELEHQIALNRGNIQKARAVLMSTDIDDAKRRSGEAYLREAEEWDGVASERLLHGREVLAARPQARTKISQHHLMEVKQIQKEMASVSGTERKVLNMLFEQIPWGLNPLLSAPPQPKLDHPLLPSRRRRIRRASYHRIGARRRAR